MIPEWVREELYKLQQRVEKLEKDTMNRPGSECGACRMPDMGYVHTCGGARGPTAMTDQSANARASGEK